MKRLSKSFKRFIVGLTAATMVFGSVGSALAANYPDVDEDSNLAGPVSRLTALNIFEGFPDGTFRPGDTVTRAQYAAVAVRAMGLEAAAAASAGNTQFPDVNNSHWASGYVNVAASQGLIEGYPDGTFRPEGQVTHAEALAILVRMLGYDHLNLPGAWPAKYIAKAAELGLTDGVTLSANLPATRGELAIMTDNSLDVALVIQAGSDNEWIVSGTQGITKQTLLGNRLNLDEIKDVLITGNWLVDNSLERNEIEAGGKVYKLVDTKSNVYDLLGAKATLWVKDETREVVTATVKDTTVTYDLVDEAYDVKPSNEEGRIKLTGAGDIRVAAGADLYVNNELQDDNDKIAKGLWGRFVRVDGKIVLAEIFDWNVPNYIVTSVDEDAERISARTYNTNRTLRLNGEDYVLRTTAGNELELADLEEDNVIEYIKDDNDVHVLWVSNKTVTGKLERLSGTNVARPDLRVDGKNYKSGADLSYSLNGKDYDKLDDFDKIKDLIDTDVEMHLNSYGRVVEIHGDVKSSSDFLYGYVLTAYRTDADYVRIVNAEGKTVNYEHTEDTEGLRWDEVKAREGSVIAYKLLSDGTLDRVEDPSVSLIEKNITDIRDTGRVEIGGQTFYGSDSTVVFEVESATKVKVHPWSLIENANAPNKPVDAYADVDVNSKLVAVVLSKKGGYATPGDFGDDDEYGIVLERWYDGKEKMRVALHDNGGIVTVEIGDGDTPRVGDIVSYSPSGSKATDIKLEFNGSTWKGGTRAGVRDVVRKSGNFLELSTVGDVPVDRDAVIYDASDVYDGKEYKPKTSDLVESSLSEIGSGDRIAYAVNDDDVIVAIIIVTHDETVADDTPPAVTDPIVAQIADGASFTLKFSEALDAASRTAVSDAIIAADGSGSLTAANFAWNAGNSEVTITNDTGNDTDFPVGQVKVDITDIAGNTRTDAVIIDIP